MERHTRKHWLIVSLLMALSASATAGNTGTSPPSDRYDLSPLQSHQRYSGFIITYRNGSAERGSAAMAVQNVKAAVSRAKLAAGTRAAPRAHRIRRGDRGLCHARHPGRPRHANHGDADL